MEIYETIILRSKKINDDNLLSELIITVAATVTVSPTI